MNGGASGTREGERNVAAWRGGAERRRTPRYGCAGLAEVVAPGRGLRFPGRIANLSAEGCFLETACRLERGTSVEIWMCTQGVPLRIAAHLMVWKEDGAGFRFDPMSERKLEQIAMLIRELEDAYRAEQEGGAGG